MLETLLFISGSVNRLVELVKKMFAPPPYVTLGLSLVLGIVGALILNANILADLTNVPAWVGIIVSGLLAGLGSDAIHQAWDLIGAVKDLIRTKETAAFFAIATAEVEVEAQ